MRRFVLVIAPTLSCAPPPTPHDSAPVIVDTSAPATAFAPALVKQTAATTPNPSLEPSATAVPVLLEVKGGLLVGAPADVIDAVDAAFVTRLDLLAVLNDGDRVIAWMNGSELVAAAAPIGERVMTIARFKGDVSGWFDDDGIGMDGAFRARPVYASTITSRYGLRFHPVDKRSSVHKGTDYGAAIGTPVHATAAGSVLLKATDSSAGNHIKIRHKGGAETWYLHLNAFVENLKNGDEVAAGQVIGFVGTTGKSTGPHLHYELRFAGLPVDAPKIVPRGLTALGPSELRRHRAFIAALPRPEKK